MKSLVSRVRLVQAGLLFGIWTVYGLLSAWQAHFWYASTKAPMSWNECLFSELTYAWIWGLLTPVILWASHRFRLERGVWPKHVLAHAALLVVVVPAAKISYDRIVMRPSSPFHNFSWESLFRSVESTVDLGILLYAVILLIEHTWVYYRRYQAGLVRSSLLQTQLVQSQLHALRMQLHPHFLFNSLHTITALVHEDPERAERTIARLSDLLRLFLANSSVHEVQLREELRGLDLYVQIEQTRFEDRLVVTYDVPDNLSDAMVPSLALQPLVENSIHHGSKKSGVVRVSVSAERVADTLLLRVTDNGSGFEEHSEKSAGPREGMGLGNTRGRLESLYGSEQSLVLRNLPASGVEARITLPFRLRAGENTEGENVHFQSINR